MTALLLSDIHTGITTIEELASYVGELCYSHYTGAIKLTNNEGVRIDYPVAQVFEFESDDGIPYRRYEFLIPVKRDSAYTPRYQWMHADEHDKVSPVAFPETFKDANLTA